MFDFLTKYLKKQINKDDIAKLLSTDKESLDAFE